MENSTADRRLEGGATEKKRWFASDQLFSELERLVLMLNTALNPHMILRGSAIENTMPEAERAALVATLKAEIEELLKQAQVDQSLAVSPFAEILRKFDDDFNSEVVALEDEEEASGPWSMDELKAKMEEEGIELRDKGDDHDDGGNEAAGTITWKIW